MAGISVGVSVRRAVAADADRLRKIATASKGHWGYDRDRVAAWAATLDFTPQSLDSKDVFVAEAEGVPIGFASLVPQGRVCVLDDLWVDPSWIRCGVGRTLFRFAAARARELGAETMEWDAEPNALGFYKKMGGRHVRETTSAWGRVNQVMEVVLKPAATRDHGTTGRDGPS